MKGIQLELPLFFKGLEQELQRLDKEPDLYKRFDNKTDTLIKRYEDFKDNKQYQGLLEKNYSLGYALGNREHTPFMRKTFYSERRRYEQLGL